MLGRVSRPRSINIIVDEQVRRWNLDQAQRRKSPPITEFVPANVITLSSELGSNGVTVVEKVGEQLNIPVYDKHIVELIASTKHVQVSTVETLDERALGHVDDFITNLLREKNFDMNDYGQALVRTIVALWGHGPCIFVGRGAVHSLPRDKVLAVRTVAPMANRVRRVQEMEHLEKRDAERLIAKIDAEREHFIRKFFRKSISDPLVYDLTINTGVVDVDLAAAIVVEAYRRKFPTGAQQAEPQAHP